MGEDANSAASILNLTITIRNIPDIIRVPMCGSPTHKLGDYVKQPNGKGYDVVVAALEDSRAYDLHVPRTAQ